MKTKRGKSKKYPIGFEYLQTNCVIIIKSNPVVFNKQGEVLKPKKLKKLGFIEETKHVIVDSKKDKNKKKLGAHVKGNDGKLYFVNIFSLLITTKDKNGKKIPGVMDRFADRRKKFKKLVNS